MFPAPLLSLLIGNSLALAAPEVLSLAGSTEGAEGDSFDFNCVAAADGAFNVAFHMGDGATLKGSPAQHVYQQDGTYTVRCVVEEEDGTQADASMQVTVSNASPVVSGTPADTVQEGVPFQFGPVVEDAGALDVHTYSATLPDGATMDHQTGFIQWIPRWQDIGIHSFELTVRDHDGGKDTLSFDVLVAMIDEDKDGLSDQWEGDHGLDSSDPTDAMLDPDGDGRTNFDEFHLQTDPAYDDSPQPPVAISPVPFSQVDTDVVTLSAMVPDHSDPDLLRFDFLLFGDAGLTAPIGELRGIETDDEGVAHWDMGFELNENQTYYWLASATDGFTSGDWSEPAPFMVNRFNEAPESPTAAYPLDGSGVSSGRVALLASPAKDSDGDDLSYAFEVWENGGVEVGYGEVTPSSDGMISYTVPMVLAANTVYCWTATAFDEHGLESPRMEAACFEVDRMNQAPSTPEILSPDDGALVKDGHVEIRIEAGLDPESRPTQHFFQLDVSNTFNTASLIEGVLDGAEEELAWVIEGLEEDRSYHLRVNCSDGDAASEWAETTFTVNQDNAMPDMVTLFNPADGASYVNGDQLQVFNATDADGDVLVYEFEVRTLQGEVVAHGENVGSSITGITEWTPGALEPGQYVWTARAIDAFGEAGDWAEVRSLVMFGVFDREAQNLVDGEVVEESGAALPQLSADTEASKTGCSSVPSGGLGLAGLLMGFGLAAGRRRD
jgi:hypothetical protein